MRCFNSTEIAESEYCSHHNDERDRPEPAVDYKEWCQFIGEQGKQEKGDVGRHALHVTLSEDSLNSFIHLGLGEFCDSSELLNLLWEVSEKDFSDDKGEAIG